MQVYWQVDPLRPASAQEMCETYVCATECGVEKNNAVYNHRQCGYDVVSTWSIIYFFNQWCRIWTSPKPIIYFLDITFSQPFVRLRCRNKRFFSAAQLDPWYFKKEDIYASGLMRRRTPDRSFKIRTVRPKSGRLVTLCWVCRFSVFSVRCSSARPQRPQRASEQVSERERSLQR